MNDKILKLKIINNNKNYEKLIKPQWTWKTYLSIIILLLSLVLISEDLEINYVELFTNSSGYFADILGRMLPPDFSNFSKLMVAMLETIEIAFLGTFLAIVLSIPFFCSPGFVLQPWPQMQLHLAGP